MHKKITIIILLLSFFLRVYALNSTPPSLYWEEAALGYDAYSILRTGKDHHGHLLPLVAFESFGDYKPAFYFYSIIPFLLIFGLSTWAVRLPSVLAGVIIVYFSGKIAGIFFSNETSKKKNWQQILIQPNILTMIFTAISPWALQFSRGGWEVNLATAFLTSGIYIGLSGARLVVRASKNQNQILFYYVLSVILLISSAYTYHATRLIAPLVGLVLAIPLLRSYKTHLKQICVLGVLGIILFLPILLFIRDPSVGHRLEETSAFKTGQEVTESNFYIQQLGSNVFTKLLFHRYWFYARTFIINAFSHFRFDFLFLSGDKIPRHSIQYFGLLFPTDFLILILGGLTLIKTWRKKYHFLWIWLLIGLIPASITQPTPHALRTLPIMPVYLIVLGFGFSTLFTFLSQQKYLKLLSLGVIGAVVVQVIMYWHFYLFAYPKIYSNDWQYGYEQMVNTVEQNKRDGEKILITREYGRPAMYYWFFTKTDPREVQAENEVVSKDQSEFLHFKNITFANNLDGQESGLIASSPKQRGYFAQAQDIATITNLKGEPVWIVYRIEK